MRRWHPFGVTAAQGLIGMLSFISLLSGQELASPIDWEKVRELRSQMRSGGELNSEERAYLQRAREARRSQRGMVGERSRRTQRGTGNSEATDEAALATTGLIPLTELPPDGNYQGWRGGLYGENRNPPPPEHLEAAKTAAEGIQPLDGDGAPAEEGGRIVLMSLGMSNTTQIFSAFAQQARGDPAVAPEVTIVDAAQGGQAANAWAEADPTPLAQSLPAESPGAGRRGNPWHVADEKLAAAGVTRAQVQAIWIKQALPRPDRLGEFPGHVQILTGHLRRVVRHAAERYPNLQLIFLSSRTYGGYAETKLNPEPYAYESAFSVQRLIQEQITGEPGLGYEEVPVLVWGPYLWANGPTPRQSDGLSYARTDFARDGTHHAAPGREKTGNLLLKFFKTSPLTKNWFVRPGPAQVSLIDPPTPPGEACFTCTLVIGYSQVGAPRGGWFVVDGAFLSEVKPECWQLLWQGGAGVDRWRHSNYQGWEHPVLSQCAEWAGEPDRVLLSISGPYGSDEAAWASAIRETVDVIRKKYPTARRIVLQPVVGGPGGTSCEAPTRRDGRRRDGRIRASWQHRHIARAIDQVVADLADDPDPARVVAGFAPQVRSCDDYSDALGHLTPQGAAAGRAIGRFYAQQDARCRAEGHPDCGRP